MNKDEILSKKEEIANFFKCLLGEDRCEIYSDAHGLVINDFFCLKVYGIESSIKNEDDITIIKESGEVGAVLCPVGNQGRNFKISEFNAERLISYFHDVNVEKFNNAEFHQFECHYLLVRKDFLGEYNLNYKESSPLWGGFTHNLPLNSYSRSFESLMVKSSLYIPSERHRDSLISAVTASNGFERFLKYYHQIELLFDVIFVAKVKRLPATTMGFRDVMKGYSKNEIDTLKSIFKEYVADLRNILNVLRGCGDFIPTMRMIFQDNGKDSNPVKDESWSPLLAFLQLSEADQTALKAKEDRIIRNESLYREHFLNIFAYWIYRVRCSIAHNREGEFIFDSSHEVFVVEFAERLLKVIIQEIFSNVEFKNLISQN